MKLRLLVLMMVMCTALQLSAQDSAFKQQSVQVADTLLEVNPGPSLADPISVRNLQDSLKSDSVDWLGMQSYSRLIAARPITAVSDLPYTIQIRPRDIRSFEGWRFYSLLVLFFLLAIFRMIDNDRFQDMVEAIWPGKDGRRFELFRREAIWINLKGTFLLAVVLGYFLFEIFNHLPMLAFRENLEIYLIVVGIAWALLLLKILADRSVGYLMGVSAMMRDYVLHVGINAYVVAFAMFPVVLLLSYGQSFLNIVQVMTIGGVLFLLSQVLRVLKLFSLARQQKGYSFFYLIIYFCALEIAPWILLFKLINTHV